MTRKRSPRTGERPSSPELSVTIRGAGNGMIVSSYDPKMNRERTMIAKSHGEAMRHVKDMMRIRSGKGKKH